MATDIELLQAAAKAAGIEAEWHPGCGDALHLTAPDATAVYWNPLADDGDALRLAVKLSLMVDVGWDKSTTVEWMAKGDYAPSGEIEQDFDGDPTAATRRAIVRAAAAMAKAQASG